MVAARARGRSACGERRKKKMLYRHLKGISADKDTGFTTAPPVARPVRRCQCGNLRRNEEWMLGWTTQQAYTRFAQIANPLSKHCGRRKFRIWEFWTVAGNPEVIRVSE
jgi:hypothetical protein